VSRVTDLLKSAVELNLKYTSTLLHLSKDYLKDAGEVITRDPAPAPAPEPPGTARAPLLIAGRSGETGNAAFALNNPGDKEMAVHLVVQGDLGDDRVKLDPSRLGLKPGGQAIVRIVVAFDDKLPVNHDYVGQVVAPGLSSQGVPFIVRRLASPDTAVSETPQAAAPVPAPAARAARTRRPAQAPGVA
jgi:hypothetical protein